MFDKHEYRQHDDGPELPSELTALERQLARLSPAAPRIDRDRLMFDAGRASVEGITQGATGYASVFTQLAADSVEKKTLPQPVAHDWRARFWPLATATMTAASVLLATLVVWQSRQLHLSRSIAQPSLPIPTPSTSEVHFASAASGNFWPFEPSPMSSSSAENYLTVRQLVLTQGLSAIDLESRLGIQTDSATTTDADGPTAEQELLKEYLTEEAALQYRI